MAELPAGAVTFLFTDIEGSTRLVKQLRDAYPQVLAEHRGLLREAFAAHNGHEIDTQGDAFFVAFASARDAVLAAVAAQRAFAGRVWATGAEVRVRIGIHTGQASPSDGRYTGVAVHRAARISAAGHGGQILISQTTHNLLEDEEEDVTGFEFLDLGEHQLKDLDRPVRLYQVTGQGLEREFPPPRTAAPAPAAAPEQPYYGRRTILIGALAGVIAAAVAIPIFALGGGGSPGGSVEAVEGDAVGVIESRSGDLGSAIEAPSAPTAVAAGLGYVWVASADANMVYALDPETRTVRDQIPLDGAPGGIAIGAGYVWATNSDAGTVAQIDPRSFQVLQTLPVGNGPTAVAADGRRYVWVSNTTDHTVSRVDIRTGESADYPAGADPAGIAIAHGRIWVASKTGNQVLELSRGGGILKEINVGEGPAAVAAGADAVWVANSLAGTVQKIDPRSATVVGAVEVGGTPSGLAVAGGRVWVANEVEGTISWIDADANEATPVRVGGRPTAVAAEGADVYVGLRPLGRVHRGGTLRVLTGGDDFFSVDPAVAYDPHLWRFLTLTNDSLVTYWRVSGGPGYQLVPDLAAAMPVISQDARTYTFELRPGIRYSSGGMVKPRDVRSSLERVFRVWPHGQGAVAQFYGGIEGSEACNRKRCDLSRGIVTNDAARTVTFHLTAPDPIFLYKLAQPFASILPSSTSRKPAPLRPVAATGPYRIASVGRDVVRLVRNGRFREWSTAAQPAGFPDEIVVSVVEPQKRRADFVQRGRADLTSLDPFDPFPVLPTWRPQLRRYLIGSTKFFVLNPTQPPFDDVRARQALNYALDRDKVVQLTGLDAAPTCQLLPPNFPGFRRYCPYTLDPNGEGTGTAPDLAKALSLVKASGTKGEDVTIRFPRTAETGRLGRYIASVLKSLGYRVHVKAPFNDEGKYFLALPASPQIASMGWLANYPTAEEFIKPLLTCSGAANLGHFCDRRIDRKTNQALDVQTQDPAAANRLWAQLDREITDKAALLPLYNVYGADLISRRVSNYQYNPQYGALLSQMWVR